MKISDLQHAANLIENLENLREAVDRIPSVETLLHPDNCFNGGIPRIGILVQFPLALEDQTLGLPVGSVAAYVQRDMVEQYVELARQLFVLEEARLLRELKALGVDLDGDERAKALLATRPDLSIVH